MSECKHDREPYQGYSPCPGCELESRDRQISLLQSENEELRARETKLVEALERIVAWPDGGNRYGQANIKVFAAEALAAHRKKGGEQ